MFKAIGIKTNTVYASGSKADCFRTLSNLFPSCKKCSGRKARNIKNVLPESVVIVRNEVN